ncbi:MAG: hypothetical protein EXS64_02910 [Candidatus Latescibacteria bacterium]|nr:hypothetical protein [Candidatus Latescibacterota bacterium]
MITKTTVKEPDTLVELLSTRASQRPDHRTYTFPVPEAGTGIVEKEWAIHEVETTSNFGTRNRLANWYLGGLNFQIEHHIFPHVCHVHYPAISRIVEETCREFSIPYVA